MWRAAALAWLVGAALFGGVFLAGTGDGGVELSVRPGATVLAASTERIELPGVRERLEGSVLLAEVTACGVLRQGTTTMLRTGSGILGFTNAHVVRGARTVRLSGAGLGVGEAEVERFLDGRDAATIDPAGMPSPPEQALEVAEAPPVGSTVYTAGFPGGAWKVQSGRLVAIEQRHGWGGDGPVLVVDVPAEEGTSGGVVVDEAGRAVGLIAARDPRSGDTIAYPASDLFTRADTAAPRC